MTMNPTVASTVRSTATVPRSDALLSMPISLTMSTSHGTQVPITDKLDPRNQQIGLYAECLRHLAMGMRNFNILQEQTLVIVASA